MTTLSFLTACVRMGMKDAKQACRQYQRERKLAKEAVRVLACIAEAGSTEELSACIDHARTFFRLNNLKPADWIGVRRGQRL